MKFIKQYSDGKTCTAWQIAQAVAKEINGMGHEADAKQGPAGVSDDDEPTVHCAHVITTDKAWSAFQRSRAEAKARKAT